MTKRKFDNFDKHASDYRDVHNKSISLSGADSEYFSEYKITELLKFEDNTQELRILDFGCGDGNSSKYLRKHFPNAHIQGIDVSEKSIQIAKERNIDNATFTSFDGASIPCEEEYFDIVFTSMVFHHIDFGLHSPILKEIRKCLKQKGRFYIFEHNPFNPLTRKVVRECPFDEDAILLSPYYTKRLLSKENFINLNLNYTIFIPRSPLFKWLTPLESLFRSVPLGAQYYIRCLK